MNAPAVLAILASIENIAKVVSDVAGKETYSEEDKARIDAAYDKSLEGLQAIRDRAKQDPEQ